MIEEKLFSRDYFMLENKYNIIRFITKYIWQFIIVGLLLLGILGTSVITSVNTHIHYLNNQITENIKEYNEIDLTHICRLSKCIKIYDDNNIFKMEKNKLIKLTYTKPHFKKLLKNLYFYNGDIIFYNKTGHIYVEKVFGKYVFKIVLNLFIVFVLFLIILSLFMYRTYKRERKEAMIANIGNEAILANKSMIMITENVHHELNTPVEVIENKVEKVHRVLKAYVESQKQWIKDNGVDLRNSPENRKWTKKIIKLDKDFEFIHLSIEQTLSVLGKMKNFKTLRYSNGNKTIYDVVQGALRIILISYCNIKCEIDEDLKKYRMCPNSLKNIDLLNVVINHFKNSIEADASKIKIFMSDDLKNNLMKLIISDNGSGIPEKYRKNIFEPNFSTKQIGDSIRGNGMYLNRHIIREFGGDIKILKTSEKGTDMEISFKVQNI